jgi:FO synthase
VLRALDSGRFARGEDWAPGSARSNDRRSFFAAAPCHRLARIVKSPTRGAGRLERRHRHLFQARGANSTPSASRRRAAQERQRRTVGYVVNRNINYTNVCTSLPFCAFSKGKLGDTLRGPAYDLDSDEIERRVREAWDRGATEVCMQGGIHPRYTGATYLNILKSRQARVG